MKLKTKYDFDDISIIPSIQSKYDTRKSIIIEDENGMLPLFASPMDTVIDSGNQHYFTENKIYGILPRSKEYSVPSTNKFVWQSYSLTEFVNLFIDNTIHISMNKEPMYILIDIANGHMETLTDVVKKAKQKYDTELILMVGNVANPNTFAILSEAGADYIRCGIGAGSGCLTSEQTAINYPMASLIIDTYEIKKKYNLKAKIVADGGFRKYADIIKGLAFGADYIMIGGLFNNALESCGETYTIIINADPVIKGDLVDQYSEETKTAFNNGQDYFKNFRGMSTKEVQLSLGNTNLKTSEGITKMNRVKHTLGGWTENFESYLRTTMSYSGSGNLDAFRKNSKLILITQNAYRRFNK